MSNQQKVQDLLNGTIQGFEPTDKVIMEVILNETGKLVSTVEFNVRTFGAGAGVITLLALNPESKITIESKDITNTYKLGYDTKLRAIERKSNH
jgi:hypothetical protein